jgi:hypothetical protein
MSNVACGRPFIEETLMNLKRFAWASAAAAFTLSWCGIASAAYTINTTGFSHTGGTGTGLTLTGDGSNNTSSGGPFQFTRGNTNPLQPTIWNHNTQTYTNGLGSQFTAFCIDLGQNLSASDTYILDNLALAPTPPSGSSPLAPMGALAAARLGVLWYQHVNGASTNGMTTADGRAAMQLAIWEIVYDSQLLAGQAGVAYNGQLSLATGNLRSVAGDGGSAAVRATAQTWLNAIDAIDFNTYAGPIANVWAMSDTGTPNAQDQLVELGPGFQIVPEPATVLIWGLGGAIGLLVARRRKQ